MESVLRQVAQLTKSITFIFSGSNRHLLSQLFDDRNRPFYKLCEKILLDRISEEAYTKHIQKIAKGLGKNEISERIIESLFNYTERHPYYMNLLCSRVLGEKSISADRIDEVWHQYVIEERSSVASEVELLSRNQRKLLTVLARTNGTAEPFGREFVNRANISKATIEQSLNFLEKRDYVFRNDKGHISVLDPLIRAVLAGIE